jgi:endonuclease/exonuclease/phosphatase family metal-dependent hydrolase
MRTAAALAALDPPADLICLQEVEAISWRSRVAFRRAADGETQLESFMRALGLAFAGKRREMPFTPLYFPAHKYGPKRRPIYSTGLAILVDQQLPIVTHNRDSPEPITHYRSRRFKSQKEARICAHVELALAGGRRLHVFNTHLSLPALFTRAFLSGRRRMGFGVNQVHEARTLAAFVRRTAAGAPFIVCGDFNAAPGSPVHRVLVDEAQAKSPEAQLGLDGARATSGIANLRMRLDHLLGDGVRWLDMEGTHAFGERGAQFDGLSDHVPLIARFQVPASAL